LQAIGNPIRAGDDALEDKPAFVIGRLSKIKRELRQIQTALDRNG
jgi:hypothetical protein